MSAHHHRFDELRHHDCVRAARAAAAGAEIHLVGGALRDVYLRLRTPDIDLVVASDGPAIASRLADALGARLILLGGERFAAYRLVRRDLTIDIWDRHGASLHSDLARRDFTINAISLDLQNGTLHDPFCGLEDLEHRVLRSVTDASLLSDPLRALRLVRFASLLPGFSVEPHTVELARAAAPLFEDVAAERIREELTRILRQARPTRAFELLVEVGLFPRLWAPDGARCPDYGRMLSTLEAYEEAETATRERPDRLLTVHTLLARFLATEAGVGQLRSSRYLTRSQTRSLTLLAVIRPADLQSEARRFLARWGALWLEAATLSAALCGQGHPDTVARLRSLHALVEAEGRRVLDPQPLLDGKQIQDLLDLPPGPRIGQLLGRLLEAQLAGEVRDVTSARELLLRIGRRSFGN